MEKMPKLRQHRQSIRKIKTSLVFWCASIENGFQIKRSSLRWRHRHPQKHKAYGCLRFKGLSFPFCLTLTTFGRPTKSHPESTSSAPTSAPMVMTLVHWQDNQQKKKKKKKQERDELNQLMPDHSHRQASHRSTKIRNKAKVHPYGKVR